MIIHDDVLIMTKGIMALQRSLDAGSLLAVPYTNDPNTDHFIGALPTDKAAERTLDHAPVPDVTKPATVVRPACVAGRSDHLIDLLTEPLVDHTRRSNPRNTVFRSPLVRPRRTPLHVCNESKSIRPRGGITGAHANR